MEVLYIYVCVCVHGSGVREFSLFIFLCIFFSSLFSGADGKKARQSGRSLRYYSRDLIDIRIPGRNRGIAYKNGTVIALVAITLFILRHGGVHEFDSY